MFQKFMAGTVYLPNLELGKTQWTWLIFDFLEFSCILKNYSFMQKLSKINIQLFLQCFHSVPILVACSKLGSFTVYIKDSFEKLSSVHCQQTYCQMQKLMLSTKMVNKIIFFSYTRHMPTFTPAYAILTIVFNWMDK